MVIEERVFYDPDWEKVKVSIPDPPRQKPTERKEVECPKPKFPDDRMDKNPYRTLFWLLITLLITNIALFIAFVLK